MSSEPDDLRDRMGRLERDLEAQRGRLGNLEGEVFGLRRTLDRILTVLSSAIGEPAEPTRKRSGRRRDELPRRRHLWVVPALTGAAVWLGTAARRAGHLAGVHPVAASSALAATTVTVVGGAVVSPTVSGPPPGRPPAIGPSRTADPAPAGRPQASPSPTTSGQQDKDPATPRPSGDSSAPGLPRPSETTDTDSIGPPEFPDPAPPRISTPEPPEMPTPQPNTTRECLELDRQDAVDQCLDRLPPTPATPQFDPSTGVDLPGGIDQ